MSCISSNFSSFFLDSLNDPSEFAKYLSNGENKCSPFDDFQVFGSSTGSSYGGGGGGGSSSTSNQQQQQQNLNGGSGSLPPASPFNNNVVHANSGSTSGNVAAAATNSAGVHNHNNSEIYNNTLEANNFNQQQPQLAPPHHPPTTPQQQQQQTQQQHQQTQQQQHHHQQQQQQQQYVGHPPPHPPTSNFQHSNNHQLPLAPHHPHAHPQPHAAHPQQNHLPHHNHHHHQQHPHQQHPHQQQHHQTVVVNHAQGYATSPLQQRWSSASTQHTASPTPAAVANLPASTAGAQHFDGSFEFLKYLRHSNDFSGNSGANSGALAASNNNNINNSSGVTDNVTSASASASATAVSSPLSAASLLDLDTSTSMKPRSARKAAALLSSATRAVSALDSSTLDVFDHDDSKHTIFDLQHHSITNSSNSNEESSMDVSNLAFPNSLLNASNSNTSSEGAAAGSTDFTNLNATASNAPKPLANFIIKENFEVHPAHKVEEGIFQHMNKLPPKKKENLKQLGVRFTGQMTLSDKSIVVENFIKFCQEYEINDHRPFLSLNQSGLNKPEQIKFARYLGQGLPSFTLFCIYSNFKNLFCTKRTETYSKEGYNLPFILDNTKHYISKSTADLKNISLQQSNDGLDFPLNKTQCPMMATNNDLMGNKSIVPKVLENFLIYENFDVHDTHRVEDGVCTHITRLPPKKQEILKQFGIQSSQAITYYEKYIIIENFIKFCNEYKISDHRPFLDFHESGLPKTEQVKFVRYLGQTLPNLTLNKIYLAFRDILGLNRIEKITTDGYNLDTILRKKKKNLYGRMHAVPI